jgi:hypothetical protein
MDILERAGTPARRAAADHNQPVDGAQETARAAVRRKSKLAQISRGTDGLVARRQRLH